MDKEHKALKKHIEKAKNILVVSHRGPDMDAFCSMLLVKEFLNIYYPSKSVTVKSKQMPTYNIPRMHDVNMVDILDKGDEDLIIIVDAADLEMVCDNEDGLIDTSTDVVVLDHHKTKTKKHKLLINEHRSSASEQVIASFKEILGKRFKLTKVIAELGQYGIVSDTGRFLYELTTSDTFRMFADLMEVSRIDLEEIDYKLGKIPVKSTAVIVELLKRITIEDDMAYTYANMEDTQRWARADIGEAINFVRNNYIRYIQGVHWGFIIKPPKEGETNWWISFRSTKGYQRVDKIAEGLGGGGHMYASAAKLEYSESKSLDQVLTDVLVVIKKHVSI